MTPLRRRSGSALIIVLGFLSFMVVSAVAFAVYMRTERIASSGFHRSVFVRQMVKAGLANAIAQVDYSMGNTPGASDLIFSPDGTLSAEAEDAGWTSGENVRVLPFEGLAYLPPAIVNEVRQGARSTPTARWQKLDYDIGRFAYVAVDVSDFFDVNKVRFGKQRNTGPGGRVSLAYLFQNKSGNALDVSGSQLVNLDKFVETRGNKQSDVPFVSLADFNVALYTKDKTGSTLGLYSPFYRYLAGGKGRAFYSDGGDENEDLVKLAERMLFVTDSWQRPTNKVDSVIDLSREEDQPFRKSAFTANKNLFQLLSTARGGTTGRAYKERLANEISMTTLANLYDYLDDNSVPISLGIPNVERVPMIASIDISRIAENLRFELNEKKQDDTTVTVGQQQYTQKTTTYCLVPKLEARMVNLVCMYPFKGKTTRQGEKTKKSSSKVQVIVKIFFTKPGQNGGGEWGGRCDKNSGIAPTKNEWDSGESATLENNCITLISSKMNFSDFPDEIMENDEAVFDAVVQMPSLTALNTKLEKDGFLLEVQRLYKKVEGFNGAGGGTEQEVFEGGYPKASTFHMLPFSSNQRAGSALFAGAVTPGDRQDNVELAKAPCWEIKNITPHIAVWARVIDDKGNTVDLAPASIYDDILNGGVSENMAMGLVGIVGDGSGEGVYKPILSAAGNKSIEFALDAQGKEKVTFDGSTEAVAPFSGTRAAFVALDPRFNSSSEDFIAKSGAVAKQEYLNEVRKLLGKEGRDPDVFMFASDQEYLQSIGELAFLPNIGELGDENEGTTPYAKCPIPIPFSDDFTRMDKAKCHCDSFWRTYPLYRQKDDGYADEDYIFRYFSSEVNPGSKVIVSDLNGFKVSPYARLEKIRLAVTANTPHSFWASSTNTSLSTGNNLPPCFTGPGQSKPIDECLKYCFNEMPGNVGPEFAWQDVTNVTARLFDQMREDAKKGIDWEDSLASMDWCPESYDPGTLFGYHFADSDDIHSVDRKTMYSFWHDSMANRQQLFLVFVRVESVAVGSNDENMASSNDDENRVQSYGGRAVALVWRDPNPPPESALKAEWHDTAGYPWVCGRRKDVTDYVPHRTRILFYHQFD